MLAGLLVADGMSLGNLILNRQRNLSIVAFGLVLLTVNFQLHHLFGWLVRNDFQQAVQHLWFVPQQLLCVLVADLAQYWTHRAYPEVPFLWRFHSVHHSVKTMDWLAGSRQHMLELIATRVLVLAPLYILGFSEAVMNGYI